MIRTRDFILFVVVLVFLVIAIAATAMRDTQFVPSEVTFFDGESTTGGYTETEILDRQSIINRLREKIASAPVLVAPEPSVTDEPNEPEEVEDEAVAGATLVRCTAPDDALSIVPKWPLSAVSVVSEGGYRVAITEEEVVVAEVVASGTQPAETTEMVRNNLLKIPLFPQKLSVPECVPSEVVGISTRGLLIFNGDMRAYRSVPENALLGYARDGFPIYGLYEGEVDTCGGYEHDSGYRYTVSSDRDYIIGCFVGSPAPFSVE